MATISLCMIVKNEEELLARCLDSVKQVVDEIIIVDTGSTDQTKEIAKRYTDKIYDFEWINDFSAARNFSYEKATMDYQMWLDADDVLPEESLQALIKLKPKLLKNDVEIVTMKYVTHFDEHDIPTVISVRERLTRRDKSFSWLDPIHECIPIAGRLYTSDIVVHHRPIHKEERTERNINILREIEKSDTVLTPRQQYYFARELQGQEDYPKAIYYFEKFLDSGEGYAEDNIASCFHKALCYKALNDEDKIIPSLLKSFEYDTPRAEVCSEIGYFYKNKKQYELALKWFDHAIQLKKPEVSSFLLCDFWGYIPNIEACVCAGELGDYEKATAYNEAAATYKPLAPAVQQNREFLASFA